MAESTAEANANTLRRGLKKILTVILQDGGSTETDGSYRVLKAIDEGIRILSCLRKVELKKPESATAISSSFPSTSAPAEVPKEFICSLSKKIMIEPVIIASGQTYEKRYITEWLRDKRTCPKTEEVLSHSLSMPNHLINELIDQWCRLNKFNRPKPSEETVIELYTYDLESLLHRICSSFSVEDQTEAAQELHLRTKKYPNVRAFFVSQLQDSVTRLLTPLGEEVNSNPKLQEHIVTTLFNLSDPEKNKTVIAENPRVMQVLTKSLKHGTAETRRNAAATLFSLSVIDSNKLIIGNSVSLVGLINLMKEDDLLTTKEAAAALYNVCITVANREKAIKFGLVHVLTNKIKEGSNVDSLLAFLAMISTQISAIEVLESLGFISDLCSLLRNNPSSFTNSHNALMIVRSMCERNRKKSILKVVEKEETQHGTFTMLASQGPDRVMRKAKVILELIKKLGDGKESQRR